MQDIKKVEIKFYKNIPINKDQYPFEFIEANNALVLNNTEELITIGITENTPPSILQTLTNFHSQSVEFVKIPQVELSSWLGNKMGETSLKESSKTLRNPLDANLIDKMANDAPTINLVNSICIDAIREKASDIHIEAGITNARVRYRIDGVLKTV